MCIVRQLARGVCLLIYMSARILRTIVQLV